MHVGMWDDLDMSLSENEQHPSFEIFECNFLIVLTEKHLKSEPLPNIGVLLCPLWECIQCMAHFVSGCATAEEEASEAENNNLVLK